MVTSTNLTREDVLRELESVKDPEIPTISVVDMGIITRVEIGVESITVDMTPTFVGCPALEVMREDVLEVLRRLTPNPEVRVNFDIPWSSNLLTDKGKIALKKHGLAPPPTFTVDFELNVLENIACPHCNSTNTVVKSIFGPTLCRSLHYCNSCLQAFEQFKPV